MREKLGRARFDGYLSEHGPHATFALGEVRTAVTLDVRGNLVGNPGFIIKVGGTPGPFLTGLCYLALIGATGAATIEAERGCSQCIAPRKARQHLRKHVHIITEFYRKHVYQAIPSPELQALQFAASGIARALMSDAGVDRD